MHSEREYPEDAVGTTFDPVGEHNISFLFNCYKRHVTVRIKIHCGSW